MKILVALVAVALAACAGPKVWTKNGSSEQDFSMESNQCRVQAYSVPFAPPVRQVMIFDACMEGKGWAPSAP